MHLAIALLVPELEELFGQLLKLPVQLLLVLQKALSHLVDMPLMLSNLGPLLLGTFQSYRSIVRISWALLG